MTVSPAKDPGYISLTEGDEILVLQKDLPGGT